MSKTKQEADLWYALHWVITAAAAFLLTVASGATLILNFPLADVLKLGGAGLLGAIFSFLLELWNDRRR